MSAGTSAGGSSSTSTTQLSISAASSGGMVSSASATSVSNSATDISMAIGVSAVDPGRRPSRQYCLPPWSRTTTPSLISSARRSAGVGGSLGRPSAPWPACRAGARARRQPRAVAVHNRKSPARGSPSAARVAVPGERLGQPAAGRSVFSRASSLLSWPSSTRSLPSRNTACHRRTRQPPVRVAPLQPDLVVVDGHGQLVVQRVHPEDHARPPCRAPSAPAARPGRGSESTSFSGPRNGIHGQPEQPAQQGEQAQPEGRRRSPPGRRRTGPARPRP